MSVSEQRSRAPELLDQLNDEFFSAVYSMLETYVSQQQLNIVGYEIDGTPITAKMFLEQADEAMAAVDRGEYITLEELEKESEEWLERTK